MAIEASMKQSYSKSVTGHKVSKIPRFYLAKAEVNLADHTLHPTQDQFECLLQTLWTSYKNSSKYKIGTDGYQLATAMVGYNKWTDLAMDEWEIFTRPILRFKIPKAPYSDMKPLRVRLFLPCKDGDVSEDTGNAVPSGHFDDITEGYLKFLVCLGATKFSEGGGQSIYDSGAYKFTHGCNWQRMDGTKEWSWKDNKTAPTDADVQNTLASGSKQSFTEGIYTGDYIVAEISSDLFVNGGAEEQVVQIMILDDFEDELPADPRRMANIYNPQNNDDIVAYPNKDEMGALLIDCEIDGSLSGVPRPILYVEWGWPEGYCQNVPQVSGLTLEASPEFKGRLKASWSAPEKDPSYYHFKKYIVYVNFNPSDDSPPVIEYATIEDIFRTEIEIQAPKLTSSVCRYVSVRVAAVYGTEYGPDLDSDFTSGDGPFATYVFPQSSPYAKILRPSDDEDEDFLVGDSLVIAGTSFSAIPGGINNVPWSAEDTDVNVVAHPDTGVLILPEVGSYVILGFASGPDDPLNADAFVIRKVVAILDPLNPGFTVDVPIGVDIAATAGGFWNVKDRNNLKFLPGLDAKIEISEFSRTNGPILAGSDAFTTSDYEQYEVGDYICFMDGWTPRIAKIDALVGNYLGFTRIGNWDPYDSDLDISDGVWFYKMPGFAFHMSQEDVTPMVIGFDSLIGLECAEFSLLVYQVTKAKPVARIDAARSVYANTETTRFYAFNSVFFGSNEIVSPSTTQRFFFLPAYDVVNLLPVPPDPPGGLGAWVERTVPYYDYKFRDSGTIDQVLNSGGYAILKLHEAHELTIGAVIEISGTTSYNGEAAVSQVIDPLNVKIDKAYVANESGTWECVTCQRVMALCCFTGDAAPDSNRISDIVWAKITTGRTVYGDFENVLDLDLTLQDGYQVEESSGGREIAVTKTQDSQTVIESDVAAPIEVTLNGRAFTRHETHPNSLIESFKWFIGIGSANKLPDDILTLKWVEWERQCVLFTFESQKVAAVMANYSRNREAGYGNSRDWSATFVILKLIPNGD